MDWVNLLEMDTKKQDIDSAKAELIEAKAIKLMLSSDVLAAEIHISTMKIGVCDIKWLLPVVNKQIKEIEKYLAGEENLWE